MDYVKFFEIHDRLSSQKQIAIVRSEAMREFIDTLASDSEIEPKFKALVVVALSGGLRINEALALVKEDFIIRDEILFVRVGVLKRRRLEWRWIRIHPQAQEFIKNYISNKIGKVFKMSQPTAYRKMQKHFPVKGICCHSLRHSAVSYLLFEEGLDPVKTAKLLHMSLDIIANYSHLNEQRTLLGIFGS